MAQIFFRVLLWLILYISLYFLYKKTNIGKTVNLKLKKCSVKNYSNQCVILL